MLMLNAGQDKAVNAVADSVLRSRAGLASQTRGSSFLFLGPTGVGKTELAKALAELLFDDEKNMVSPCCHDASSSLACAIMELRCWWAACPMLRKWKGSKQDNHECQFFAED